MIARTGIDSAEKEHSAGKVSEVSFPWFARPERSGSGEAGETQDPIAARRIADAIILKVKR